MEEFRRSVSKLSTSTDVDEERFKFLGGFNDFFVVIACFLVLFSSIYMVPTFIGIVFFALLSWGLSELFILKRKMPLLAIVLTICFIVSVYCLIIILLLLDLRFESTDDFFTPLKGMASSAKSIDSALMIAHIKTIALTCLATYCHWLRFKVPITVSILTMGVFLFLVLCISLLWPFSNDYGYFIAMTFGLTAFCFAMWWDAQDITRVTKASDVAFWLHLVSAPFIIHPIFSSIGVFDGDDSLTNLFVIVSLYLALTLISIIINRRALMISSLGYVLYALTNLVNIYGDIEYGFALMAFVMGVLWLILSVFWHSVRVNIVGRLPNKARQYLPAISA